MDDLSTKSSFVWWKFANCRSHFGTPSQLKMVGTWDVFFMNSYCYVDKRILEYWIEGSDIHSTVVTLMKSGVLKEFEEADEACVISEVNDHYRLFKLLERYLEHPSEIFTRRPLLLTDSTLAFVIERYYHIDDSVVREICGKRPSGKMRKEAEEISEKTGVSIVSCRRQLNNFRRVYKLVDDMKGSLLSNIKKHFLLPTALAKKYATTVFLACYRFELNKKRLGYLNFEDLATCSVQMIHSWSCGSDQEFSIDREFLHQLKELKMINDRERMFKFKAIMMNNLKSKLSEAAYESLKEIFKPVFKSLIEIAVDLNHSRDFRDFFVDLAESIIIPCKFHQWTKEDLTVFLDESTSTVRRHYEMELKNEIASNWQRYMNVLTACALQMYHL